jgi:tRNA threonylcarbamoyladenosine biosynthesis protein TsaB
MIILCIKTDQKIAELGLFDSDKKLDYISWEAHRELSATIHKKIGELLESQNLSWHNIKGIVFYEGPGSFTGLRIGASVANALAASLDIPVAQSGDKNWIRKGREKLSKNLENRLAIPRYGSLPHVATPKK